MKLSNTPDGRAAVAVGAACWMQLCVVPLAAHPGPPLAWLTAALAAAVLAAGALDVAKRLDVTRALATAGFLAACGLHAAVLGASRVPRFDASSQVLAALSALAYLALAARAFAAGRGALPAALTPLSDAEPAAPSGPALRGALSLCVAAVALACAVLAPARLGADAMLEGLSSRAAERLLRGRTALTAAGGLALGVAIALSAGAAAMRAPVPRERRATRALTYGVWAGVAWSMRAWLDHAR